MGTALLLDWVGVKEGSIAVLKVVCLLVFKYPFLATILGPR